MKRQDAVNEIMLEIAPYILDYEKARECAESTLSKMEELGMLPPTIKLSHINANDNGWE